MKTKILILLPIVFSVGLLLGHLMLVLASVIIKNPGHTADQINAGTFADDDNYIFKSGAKVGIGTNPSLTLDVNGDVRVGGARISFTGVDGTGYSWIRRSYIDDTNILLGWDSKGNTRIPSGKSLITSDQTCPTGWNCEIKTWDIAAQSGQFYGDLKVSGTIYGWNVPSEIIFTSVHSGGNFGKWKGMHDWIQGNGCSGYHVCNEFEVLAFIETGKTINWGSVSDTQLGAIYTLQENCDQWTTNAGIGWRGTVWTINNQFDGSVNCAQNFRVLCCK